jgi:palmitoyl-[glycerolipid] 3-(E)-desaturase
MAAVADRQAQIDKLNERVEQITRKAVEKHAHNADDSAVLLAPEFVHAQMPMTLLTAGAPVYQLRCAPLVYLYATIALGLVTYGASSLSPLVTLACVTAMFLGYDVYSGVLHVVLDHPANIAVPVLGQPCLEFQWHHSIPDDIVRKDFVDVCGDLNVVIGLLIVLNAVLLPLDSGIALVMGGTKLLMAYFGQFSHRSAHSMGKSLSPVAQWLQRRGFMVSTKAHMSHHQAPYNVDYCLVGPGNALIDFMRTVTQSNAVWLSVFLVWSLLDIYAMTYAMEYVTTRLGVFSR